MRSSLGLSYEIPETPCYCVHRRNRTLYFPFKHTLWPIIITGPQIALGCQTHVNQSINSALRLVRSLVSNSSSQLGGLVLSSSRFHTKSPLEDHRSSQISFFPLSIYPPSSPPSYPWRLCDLTMCPIQFIFLLVIVDNMLRSSFTNASTSIFVFLSFQLTHSILLQRHTHTYA